VKGVQAAHKEGKPLPMPGYISTSVGLKVLEPFHLYFVHLHIKAVHCLDVYPVSLFPGEGEVLLNHNCSYLVKEIKMEGPRWIIALDQLPP
jgi:hypothetical protein